MFSRVGCWVFLVAAAVAFGGCWGGDDDSPSSDSGVTDDDDGDDDAAGDDTSDDDADDDAADDDSAPDDDVDDDSDDDADDDDTGPDWSREPLAVLACDPAFADPGEVIDFDGAASSDPNGLALTYALDFGDGEIADVASATHAYANAGVYRATLTVTNAEGFADASSCVVQVGEFPTAVGTLDGIDFHPNYFRTEIIETGAPPFGGGLVYGFFTSPGAATADTILVNGQNGHPDDTHVEWCEIVDADLLPAGVGAVQCHSYDDAFLPGEDVNLVVKAGTETLWSFNGPIPAPTLSPTFITANVAGDELLIYARNDADEAVELTGLAVDGLDVSDFVAIESETLAPGGTGLIRVPRAEGIDYGMFHVFTVLGETGRAPVSGTRFHRVFPPIFPLGNWDGSSDEIYDNADNRAEQLDYGIDMHIYGPSGDNHPDDVVPLAENEGVYLFTHEGGTNALYEEYIANWGDSPAIAANAVFGEPDLNGEAIDSLAEMQLQRDLWGTKKPQWGYNACAHRWPAFQALPDIGGMDHYCVFAPKCNTNWPPYLWDHLWFLGYYAESAKINSEPKPVWDWTQANNWGDLYFFNRCLTDEEIRAQWYVVLGRGVKGLLWFRFSKEWMETCPEPLPEMKRLARELDTVEPFALEGEWMTPGLYATTPDSTIDTQATFGPRGALIVLTNFHYDLNLIAPWIWHEKINIPIDVYPPGGFEPARFQLVANEDLIDLAWAKIDEGHWRVMLPSLTVAEMILVTPEP
ncbi:MAG: PKD domain-containing protein [Deltaproteobacteria bacterium]|nr:PKD domain-containing protein [Deltaproteobacteria bacterium]